MALDRIIALIFLALCLVYGYSAFFMMDAGLPPFMRRNPIWPSTLPKILAVLGAIASIFVLLGVEKPPKDNTPGDLDLSEITGSRLFQAAALLALMLAYALLLRPLGFLISTASFLILGAVLLGERKPVPLLLTGVIASGAVWYLVQEVLGIYLRPLPGFLGGLG